MTTPDWTLLRAFLAVIDTGSLSAGALALATSQPTLSRHIRALETSLGVPLFTRSAHGLDPTDAALALVDDARAMGAAADALALKAWGRSQQPTGTVRITASMMVANFWLPPMLAALRSVEPAIQVEVVASDSNQDLLRRDADIAIRMADPTQNALIARKLGVAPVGLYGAASYFARRGRVATMADLLAHDVIGADRSDGILKVYAASGQRVGRGAFPLRCDDETVRWHLLLAGAGLGFAQVALAERYPALERVALDLVAPMPVWLVLHEEVRSNLRIRRVADFLAASITEQLQAR